jgi:hypothetical protein
MCTLCIHALHSITRWVGKNSLCDLLGGLDLKLCIQYVSIGHGVVPVGPNHIGLSK